MQNRCENCKYWFDYGQKVGKCDKIKNKVYVDNSDNYFETDYDFSCNLYAKLDKYKRFFVQCLKDIDDFKEGGYYLVEWDNETFKSNVDLNLYFEFKGYDD